MIIKNLRAFIRQKLNDIAGNDSLRHRVIRASGWTIGGHFTNQILRLAGNLILTRLLFPEAFGLMAIVQSVIFGLTMLSDVGLESSIIQNKRGHETIFVNTAWTIHVIQGAFIWLALCLLAPLAASFYVQPILASLLPVVGIGAVLGGLESTKLALASRTLALKKRVLIETGSYALGLVVTILWAWVDHSIWSLVGGGLLGAAVKTAASHFILEGESNKFAWESDSVKTLFGFGQWVLVSSTLTFLAGEGSKLLIAAFLGVKPLAFFTLASTMSLIVWQITQQLSSKALFPAYSAVVRDRPERLKAVAARSRLLIIVPGWLAALFFVLWGDQLMQILYDRRYADSGYMLQMLGMGNLIGTIGGSYTGLLWAKGMVRASTVLLAVQIIFQVVGIIIGNHFWGEHGVILGLAAANWLTYPMQAYIHAKIGLWEAKIDFSFIVASIFIVILNFENIFSHI